MPDRKLYLSGKGATQHTGNACGCAKQIDAWCQYGSSKYCILFLPFDKCDADSPSSWIIIEKLYFQPLTFTYICV